MVYKIPIVALYIGMGQFISGIPKKDLTVDHWAGLTPAQRLVVENSALYEMVTPEPVANDPGTLEKDGT